MDIALTQAINSLSGRNPELDALMICVTTYGVFVLVAAVVLLWWSKSARFESRNACIVAGLSFLISLGFNQLLLLFLNRVRPYDAGISHLIIAANPDWSFPSDHATAASAVVAAIWLKGLPRIAGALGMLAIIICISRVYVGVHYVSDVFGGVVIGIMTALAIHIIYRNECRYAQRLTSLL